MTMLCALILAPHFVVRHHVVLPQPLYQITRVRRDGSLTGFTGYRMVNDEQKWPLTVWKGKLLSARRLVTGDKPHINWGAEREDSAVNECIPLSSEVMKVVDSPPLTRRCPVAPGVELVRWGLYMGPVEHMRTLVSIDGKLQPIPGLGKLVACDVVTVGDGWFVVDAMVPHKLDDHAIDTGRGDHVLWIEWK